MGDQGRKIVIIPEFDFVHSNGIVFVDNRDDSPLQKGDQGVTGIQVPLAIGQVFTGQEYLGHQQLMGVEGLFISIHQTSLPDGRHGLFPGESYRVSGSDPACPLRRQWPRN